MSGWILHGLSIVANGNGYGAFYTNTLLIEITLKLNTMITKKNKQNALYTLLAAVSCFVLAYGMASFATWEIDLRKWDMVARWGVIWGSFTATILCVMLRKV